MIRGILGRVAFLSLVTIALAVTPSWGQSLSLGDSIDGGRCEIERQCTLREGVLFSPGDLVPMKLELESQKKDLVGAGIGGVAGALLARELTCAVQDTPCGLEPMSLLLGAVLGGILGAGIASGF